jgi:1-acyl-sn-glycerol-3-phosphate acyltransferase
MKKDQMGWGYRLTKAYFRWASTGIFLRHYYRLGTENIPAPGTPTLVAMNHQNAFLDALGVLLSKDDRRWHFIARADAFDIHPLFGKFILWAGVLPAFRLQYQGEEALANNDETFRLTEEGLLSGQSVLIFPEAGHQDKHWLGTFSYGYTRMAFQAAEKANFEKEIFILPAANHYSAYTGLRNRMLVRFGTPVSLQPYYELYKEKPRTAQREVNRLVRAQIEAMMLDIQDLDHYADIDFARTLLPRPNRLPEQLEADQALVHRLEGFDFTAVGAYRQALENDRLQDSQFTDRPNWGFVVADMLLLLLLLPLAILALWPSLLCWYLPKYFSNRLGDVMLQSSFHVGLNVLVLLPLSFCLTWLVTGLCAGCWIGLAHALLIGPLCIFEWYYAKLLRDVWRDIRFLRKDTAPLAALRAQALSSLKTE